MGGHVYVIQGDITKCRADAIAFSTSTRLEGSGKLYRSFAAFAGFAEQYAALKAPTWRVGDTHWIPPDGARPGIVVTFSIARHNADPAGTAGLLVASAIECALANLPAVPERRMLVLLPTFLTGAGGAGRMRADLARDGWRASRGNHALLRSLARNLTDRGERERLLQAAIAQADSEAAVEELVRLLDE